MCEVDFLNLGLSIPALRGSQGGRDLYVALPNNGVINTFFPTHIEAPNELRSEQLDAEKVARIARYISADRDSYVLGAITYATDSDCQFDEAFPGSQFGVLRLPLNAKLRTIDGQHRREALRSAVEVFAEVASEHTPLMLFVEPSLEKRRQMFADMNSYPSHPADRERQSTDPFEAAAIKVSTEHPLLIGRVTTNHRKGVLGKFDYDISDVVDALKRLFVGATGRVKSPARYSESEVLARGLEFFGALAESPFTKGAGDSASSMTEAAPVLKVLAGTAWRLRFDEIGPRLSDDAWKDALSRVDFGANGAVWVNSGMSDGASPTADVKRPHLVAAIESLVGAMTATAHKAVVRDSQLVN